MSESQFSFLEAEFLPEFDSASRAERYTLSDPGAAVIYARKSLESAVKWMYQHDRSLAEPYDATLGARLNDAAFRALESGRIFDVARKIQRAGNRAVHESKAPSKLEAVEIVSALFQFCLWFAFNYGRTSKPELSLQFNPHRLLDAGEAERASLRERQETRGTAGARVRRARCGPVAAGGIDSYLRGAERRAGEAAGRGRRSEEEGGRDGPARGLRLV